MTHRLKKKSQVAADHRLRCKGGSLFFVTLCLFFIFNHHLPAQPSMLWQKSYGGTYFDEIRETIETRDGHLVSIALTASYDGDVIGQHGVTDYWVLKMDTNGNLIWAKTCGGGNYDWPYAIIEALDGGYVLCGLTQSTDGDVTGFHGGEDVWIVKLSEDGDIEWQKCYGGSGYESARDIQQTPDGGYIFSGESGSTDGDVTVNRGGADMWVVKLNATGQIQWQRSIGGSSEEMGNAVQLTPDGGYIVAGSTSSTDGDIVGGGGTEDYLVVKLDSAGNIDWLKLYGGNSLDIPWNMNRAEDGYILNGISTSINSGDVWGHNGFFDYWVLKLDFDGNIMWQKCLGGTDQDRGYSIVPAADGGYIAAGSSSSLDGYVTQPRGNRDFWAVKLDASGEFLWEKSLGGTLSDVCFSVIETADGGIVLSGFNWSEDGDATQSQGYSDAWVVKLAPEGTGMAALASVETLSVFPNPAGSSVTLQTPEPERRLDLGLYDLPGRLLHHQILEENLSLDLGTVPPGAYLIRAIGASGRVYTGKLIRE
ncbi:MAG: T9SS type A sorting domain-containing protein [Saprospiraceae bacterium]|nr:T9SS type A sorting domain-containing protein [Saprospiraceae bacterium]